MLPPEIEAKYAVAGTLGSGAMGTVYDATDRMIERRVAVKVVRLPPKGDPEGEEAHARFRREAQAAGRLSHPNIVGVFDYGENADAAWIVMELVEGGSLKGRLDRHERFPVPEIVRVMEQMLSALAYSHGRGVVHRDIKPGNVMLAEDGTVKLADFGIARLENSSMTQIGTVMGTPSYMAPEQLRGETVDARADLWAAGVVLYQLLTGEKPFEGGFSAVMHKALNTEPTPPSQLAVTAPRAFDAVVARALAKRPEDRYPTAAAFAQAIREAATAPAEPFAGAAPLPGMDGDATLVRAAPAAPKTAVPAPASPPAKRPRWALIGGGIAAALVAVVAGVLLLGGGEGGAERDARIRAEAAREAQATAERLRGQQAEAERAGAEAAQRAAQEAQRTEAARADAERARQAADATAATEARRAAEAESARQAAEARAREEQARAEAARRQQSQAQAAAAEQRAREEQARADAARAEAERTRQAAAAAAAQAQAQAEAERRAREEAQRAEAARAEQARQEAARVEAQRAEQARAEMARAEQARAEQARTEAQRAEQGRQDAQRAEQARVEAARAEQQRAEQARQEAMRADAARAEQARQDAARAEAQRAEQARAAEAARLVGLRQAADAVAGSTTCAALAVTTPDGTPTLVGPLRRGTEPAVRNALAARGVAADGVRLGVQPFDGPYCPTLDAVRPVAASDATPRIDVAGRLPLARGELLRFGVGMPDWPGQLHVTYLMQSGDVAHLVASRPEAAGAQPRLGDPGPGFPGWEVDEPFGTDLLLVLVSDRPLFPQRRPAIERQEAFAPALAAAIRAVQAAGGRVQARAMVLETVARR